MKEAANRGGLSKHCTTWMMACSNQSVFDRGGPSLIFHETRYKRHVLLQGLIVI